MFWSQSLLVISLMINFSYSQLVGSSDSALNGVQNPSSAVSPDDPFNLSPYELHVILDLLFELPSMKCPSIDRVTTYATKMFIEERMLEVHQPSKYLHPEFVPIFQNLIYCLKFLRPANPTGTGSPKSVIEEKLSKDGHTVEDLVKEFKTQVELNRRELSKKQLPTNKPKNIITSAWDLISNIISHDRSAQLVKSLQMTKEERRIARKKELIKNQVVALGDFQMLMAMLSRVIANSCPVRLQPDQSFIDKAIKEVIVAVASDKYQLITAKDFYFEKHGLWGQVRECAISVEKATKLTDTENSIESMEINTDSSI